MHPGDAIPDYVLQRDFDRYTTAQDKRWDALVVKVDSLADSTLVDRQRLNSLERLANEKSTQTFSTNITAAQMAAGCATAVLTVFLGLFASVASALLVIWFTHK